VGDVGGAGYELLNNGMGMLAKHIPAQTATTRQLCAGRIVLISIAGYFGPRL
jgi:hypothetical protein